MKPKFSAPKVLQTYHTRLIKAVVKTIIPLTNETSLPKAPNKNSPLKLQEMLYHSQIAVRLVCDNVTMGKVRSNSKASGTRKAEKK